MYDIYYCTKCKTEHGGYNGERAYQGLWTAHQEYKERGRPEAGKLYALTGATGAPCIGNGNSWAESEVKK